MGYFILLTYVLILNISCNNSPNTEYKLSKTDTTVNECQQDYDSVLVRFSQQFQPSTINLNSSLSPELNSFLLGVDTNCFRRQKFYPLFISSILAKLFYYHIVIGHQSYDLQFNEEEGGKVIIEEFKRLAGYDKKRYETLGSGAILDYINKHNELKNAKELSDILTKINKKEDSLKIQFGKYNLNN